MSIKINVIIYRHRQTDWYLYQFVEIRLNLLKFNLIY